MKYNEIQNENYCATVAKVSSTSPIVGADRIHNINVLGNNIVVQKSVNVGDIGIYIPSGCRLSPDFVKFNNLYTDSSKNKDTTKTGYLSSNRRIRYVKLKNSVSEGLFLPINSLYYIPNINLSFFKIGDSFDSINVGGINYNICEKYIIPLVKNTNKEKVTKKSKKTMLVDFMIENQFNFHHNTPMLYKNLSNFSLNDYISITYKLHGSSGISSKVLIKRHLSFIEKLLLKLKVNINTSEFGYIYSSGKPKSNLPKGIETKYINKNKSFYESDIWYASHQYLKPFLKDGMTFYYEIVGFTQNGVEIQKNYDYGCIPPTNNEYVEGVHYKVFIYRITYTNSSGNVFEFTTNQMYNFCDKVGLKTVPLLFEGTLRDFFNYVSPFSIIPTSDVLEEEFLNKVKEKYNDKECFMCRNKVVEEGVVIRKEDTLYFEAYKQKSSKFYEYENKMLDEGISNEEL